MFLLRKVYDWTLEKSKHPKAAWFLSIISFAESSFFPIPPDIILIPMIISNRIKAWYYAFICTLSSVFGGIFGYLIGSFFYSTIGTIIVSYYSLEDQFGSFENYYNEFGILVVLGASFTPFPYKFITIASGVFGLNIYLFIFVSLIGRGLRFFIIALLLNMFGKIIREYIDKYFNLLALIFFVLLILSFLFIKFI